MKIVIAGGTGFLGRVLTQHFEQKGDEVVILSRGESGRVSDLVSIVHWDGKTQGDWASSLEGADVLINLSGKSVNCRYNDSNKEAIYASRLQSTAALNEAVAELRQPPSVWLNASSATIYRHAQDRPMDEKTGELGEGFSVDVCQKWEKVFFDKNIPGVRKVALRTSLVLGKQDSVYPAYRDLVEKYLGGTQGSGEQFVSWLHEEDFTRIVSFIIGHPQIEGAVNVCAPSPVKNRHFMKAFRESLNIPAGLRTYSWMVKLGAFFMRTEEELVLKSRRVVPALLLKEGYCFSYPCIEEALKELAHSSKQTA